MLIGPGGLMLCVMQPMHFVCDDLYRDYQLPLVECSVYRSQWFLFATGDAQSLSINKKQRRRQETRTNKKQEEEEETLISKKSSCSSPAMRRRANERMDRHPTKLSKLSDEHDAREKKRICDELVFGFRSELRDQLMKSLQIVTVPKSVIIPVTFRATGFMCQFLYCKFAQLQIQLACCTVQQLFRVTLLQLEARINVTMREQQRFQNFETADIFYSTQISVDFVNIVSTLRANFAPFANMIRNLGWFKGFGTAYIPRVPAKYMGRLTYVLDPTSVTYSNLAWVVAALTGGVPVKQRKYFYDHNPLPGAIWRGEMLRTRTVFQQVEGQQQWQQMEIEIPDNELFPILANPQAFWPDGYNMDSLVNDVGAVASLIKSVGRKYPKYVHYGAIDYRAPGSASILVSNAIGNLRCNDLEVDNGVGGDVNFKTRPAFSGSIRDYWSPEQISDSEFYIGSCHLFGESPRERYNIQGFGLREQMNAKQEADIDYQETITNLLG